MAARRTIGKLAKEGGVSVETVRFYERKGLLDQPPASDGYRDYDDVALATVRYIKIAQRLGFRLADILALRARLGEGDGFCAAVRETARQRMATIATEIAELQRLERELQAFLTRCAERPPERPCSILLELGALDKATKPQSRKGKSPWSANSSPDRNPR
jgi:MerR family mercuric resistance operon transcriptional regulator